jgi:hypothetical protein
VALSACWAFAFRHFHLHCRMRLCRSRSSQSLAIAVLPKPLLCSGSCSTSWRPFSACMINSCICHSTIRQLPRGALRANAISLTCYTLAADVRSRLVRPGGPGHFSSISNRVGSPFNSLQCDLAASAAMTWRSCPCLPALVSIPVRMYTRAAIL